MSQVPVFQVLENLRSVLVVLIPVGQISQEKFVTYAQHVSSCTSFALQEYVEFNHPPTQGATLPGGFDHRNWNRDIIHLRYEIQHSHSDWEELFLFQKPFAVVGIADCSVENDLTATFNKFSTLTSRYRISPSTSIMQQGTVPKTCLAFELRKDQKDPDLGTFKVIPDQDFAHFNFYITHIFGEELVRAWLPLWENTVKADPELLADLIFDSLYGGSDNVSNPSTSHTALLTQLDSDWPDEAPKGRKRRLVGRIRKQQGDLCLFAGSPIDALNQYRIAIEILRSCSDWEWVGSALESSAAAIISLREATGEGLLPADILDISSKLSEARTCYSRRPRATYLECENLIRSAVFFQKAERHLEMADMLSKCQEIVELLDSANLMGRIQLYSAIALVYRNANFTRKYAFFIQLVCRLCFAAEVPAARAHQLLEQVAPEYDITANSLIEPVTGKPAAKTRRAQLIDSGAPWSKLQASILSLLIDLSTASGNTVQSIKYLVYMMREVAPQLLRAQHTEPSLLAPNKTDWSMKLKQLSMQMPPPLDTAEGDPLRRGLGMLTSWKPLKDQGMYMHISRSVSDPLFLYRPNRKAKEAIAASASHVFAWPGHTIYFDVSLRNSMAQKAILEDVRISFSVIVLTTTEIRAGDTRMDVDYLPPITVEACIQPSAQIVIDPGDSITVKLSALVPNLRNNNPTLEPETDEDPLANLLKDSRFKILLAPSELTYSMFNCPFSEPMLKMFNTPVKQLLLTCLHYVHNVPTVSVEDSSHPWISYTTATRDPDLVIAMPKTSMLPVQPILSTESRLNVTLSQESQPESKFSSSAPTKSVHHLTIATSQLRGERLLTTLVLKNESIYDVEDFGLTIQENGETISPTKPSQVLIGEPKAIYDIISKALPLRPGERLELPLEFMAPGLGLVQVSFLMEYRNNVSAENMWRKLRMDYSFKVVESLKPLKVDVLQCSESSLEVLDRSMPHRVIVVGDEREITIDTLNDVQDEESYLLLMLSIQNKTMVSFHCAKDDQIADGSSMDTHHTTFVVDPWGTKNFCMALHRQTFVRKMEDLVTQGASPSFEQACRDFFTAHLRISWRSYGNRVGTILFDANLIEDAILKKLRPQRVFTKTWMVDMKGSRILARPSEESHLPSVHLQPNQIYKLNTEVHCLNSPRIDNTSTYFSALCKAHHLNNHARNYSWIGKAQNIALPHITPGHSTSAQVPIVFHHPGVYTISVRVHDAHIESPEDYWSRDIWIIVAP